MGKGESGSVRGERLEEGRRKGGKMRRKEGEIKREGGMGKGNGRRE